MSALTARGFPRPLPAALRCVRPCSLWKLDLPEGMSSFNGVYGMIMLAGTVITALIYIKWAGAAVNMTSDLIASMQGQGQGQGQGGTAAAAAKTLTAGGGSAKKQRGNTRREEKKQQRR